MGDLDSLLSSQVSGGRMKITQPNKKLLDSQFTGKIYENA